MSRACNLFTYAHGHFHLAFNLLMRQRVVFFINHGGLPADFKGGSGAAAGEFNNPALRSWCCARILRNIYPSTLSGTLGHLFSGSLFELVVMLFI